MYSNDYLLKNGITDIEELVNKSVYFVFSVQGIIKYKIRRVQYGKQQEWLLCVPETYKVSELGKSIFFTKEEAEKYQVQQLYEYTKEQRDHIIRNKLKIKEKELDELYKLLDKYPTSDSRILLDLCDICIHYDYKYRNYNVCNQCKNGNCCDYDINKVKEILGE